MDEPSLPVGTVTFLFTDIEDSSALLRRVGDDVFASIRGNHRQLLREAFTANGGSEIDTAGDGFFVAFDSARSAVAAAVRAQVTHAAFDWPNGCHVRVRMGLHTAEPHLSDEGYVGLGVHRASRICDAARGGQILVSNATAGIVEDAELTEVELLDLGEHRLKGLSRPQRLFQLSVLALPSTFEPPRTAELDRQVPGVGTFFFSDLLGFGHLIRSVGDEATAALVTDYHSCVTREVETTRGIVLEQAGDHVRAVFHNASDAIQAAVAVREALNEFVWPPDCNVEVGIVLHSARWSGDPRDPRAGTAMLKVTRLGDTVEPAQVLVSQTTAGLLEGDPNVPALRSIGTRTLSDTEPIQVYEVIDSE